MRLRGYGSSSQLETAAAALQADGDLGSTTLGRVVFHSGDHYRVMTSVGERPAQPLGRLRHLGEVPAVGDWVLVGTTPPGASQPEGQSLPEDSVPIVALLPRRTRLSRKVAGKRMEEQTVAANVDTVFIVMGLDGDFNLRRLERFAVMVWESGAQPVAVLTKADLHHDPVAARLDAVATVPGVPVQVVSTLQGEGLAPLRAYLGEGSTVALVGSSGAGKSTLLNRLCGEEVMRTGAVRAGDDRGRHTTTHRQLVPLPLGGVVIDNPGVREIQLWADGTALEEAFDDIAGLARGCRFRDCRHEHEPGCAVLEAVEDLRLPRERLESCRKLDKELAHLERQRSPVAQRREDRRLGRMYKRVQAEKLGRRRG